MKYVVFFRYWERVPKTVDFNGQKLTIHECNDYPLNFSKILTLEDFEGDTNNNRMHKLREYATHLANVKEDELQKNNPNVVLVYYENPKLIED